MAGGHANCPKCDTGFVMPKEKVDLWPENECFVNDIDEITA